jgi:hypothetical protein
VFREEGELAVTSISEWLSGPTEEIALYDQWIAEQGGEK